MKSLFPFLLATLLLSGCTGETAVSPSPSSVPAPSAVQPSAPLPSASETPEAAPWWEGLTAADLPDALSAAEDVAAGSGLLYRLAQLPEQDITLYGYGGDNDGAPSGVLLAWDGVLTPFEQVYLSAENPMLPQMRWTDLDGDNSEELSVVYLTANSAASSIFEFHVYAPQADGSWQDHGLLPGDYGPVLDDLLTFSYDHETNTVSITVGSESISAWYDGPGEPDGLVPVGDMVFFRYEDGGYTAVFGLQLSSGDDTRTDIGSLTARVAYDGSEITLTDFQLNAFGGV